MSAWQDPGYSHDQGGTLPTTFVDHEVVDLSGDKLGKVADVVSDSSTLEPRWLVVASGAFKHSHFVPVAGSYTNEDGQIVVPHDKDVVMHSGKAGRDHVLMPEHERELAAYYGLN